VELKPDCQGSFVRYLKRVVDGTAPGPVVAMTGGERDIPNALPSSAPTPSARIRRGATVTNSFALIVGIEHYRDLPASTGAIHDAESFAALARESLGVPEENVRRLNDEHATRADLESELHWLQLNAQKADRVYFYFGGHGTPDPTTGSAFLLPYDTNPTDPAAAGLALDSALQALAATDSQNVIAFVDSCFSGAGGRSVLPAGARPLAIVKAQVVPPQVALFSAAGPNQISGMNAQGNGGLFTEYVFDGVGLGRADANGDGNVSLGELATWVTPEVRKAALRANRDQTPLLQFANTGFDPAALVLLRSTQAK
jgi:hypothetical protein